MYSVYKVNKLDVSEIDSFIESSKDAILRNSTESTLPNFTKDYYNNTPDHYKVELRKHFQTPDVIYKQTKNGEPVFIRKATTNSEYKEDGYLTLEFGLINFYNNSKSFIYEQEFWDAWHECVKGEGHIGWATILAESATTEAYKRVIEMGLLGDDVYYGPMRVDGQAVPGYKKIKVTF